MSEDILAPIPLSYNLTSYDIDLSAGDAAIHTTARIQDDISGLLQEGTIVYGGTGRWRSSSGQSVDNDVFGPTSGTNLDGEYSGTLELSKYGENGSWTLESFCAQDAAGNHKCYSTQELDSLGIRTTLNVTGGSNDTSAPTPASYQLSSYEIDLSAGDVVLDATARFTDDISGVCDYSFSGYRGPASQFTWISASGKHLHNDIFMLTSGTSLDGEYSSKFLVPASTQNGMWTLSGFTSDNAGNFKAYNTKQLNALGIRTTLNVVGGISDGNAPNLISYQLSTYDIDLTRGDAIIDVFARITDDASGVFTVDSPSWNNTVISQCRWRSSSGQWLDGGYFTSRSSGTGLDGEYSDQVVLTKFAQKGAWTLDSFTVCDEAGNFRIYDTSELSALGVRTTFTVSGNWVESKDTISLDASVDNVELIGSQKINAIGSDIGNVILGNSAANQLSGRSGNDRIMASGGNDSVVGGTGNDDLNGGLGDDFLYSGDGDDIVDAGEGNDEIVGGDGKGNDTYKGGSGIDAVRYSSAVKFGVSVDLANKVATGREIGRDQLVETENVIGGFKNDIIIGDDQINVLTGGEGRDDLKGNGGIDTFAYATLFDSKPGEKFRDIIQDFNARQGEKIDLSAIDAYTSAPGNQGFTFIGASRFSGAQGEVRFSNEILQVNTGTDKMVDMEIALSGVAASTFTANQLVL